jgi:uncharacterized RDD family membrane protein YckC
MSDLVIAEGVELELRPARLATRFAAFALDLLVQVALGFMFLLLGARLAVDSNTDTAHALGIITSVLILIGYPVVCETVSTGRSVGKLAVGLRVVRLDGGPERFRHALVRALAGWFADIGMSFGLAGACTSASSPRGQRIGDLLAGTIVVRERNAGVRGSLPLPPAPALAGWAGTATVQDVPVGLIVAARQLISRIFELDRRAAADLSNELARQFAAYVRPSPPAGTPSYHYLVAVTGERFRREASAAWSGTPAPAADPDPGRRH